MDITSCIGVFFGIACILLGQHLEGGHVSSILQVTAFLIVFGGTIGAALLSYPVKHIIGALLGLKAIFLGVSANIPEVVNQMVELALKARKEGILALQGDIKAINEPFLRKGLELMTDGTDPGLLRDLLETELSFEEEEITASAKFWEDCGAYTPTVGILGAVLGLIHVMENLDDPSKLGGGIATAFVATVYGVGAANLIFIPMSKKMKANTRQAIVMKEMMIEGILSIQAGESPNFIKQKLAVFDLTGKVAAEIAAEA